MENRTVKIRGVLTDNVIFETTMNNSPPLRPMSLAEATGLAAVEAANAGVSLAGAYLRGVDLTGANLRGADLRGADLSNADLREAILSGAYLTEACLTDSTLMDARLLHAALENADLAGANFRRASLHCAQLHNANLYGTNLSLADLSQTCIIDGGTRSDGYRHIGWMRHGQLMITAGCLITAGCRNFTVADARRHWQTSRGGRGLSAESLGIVDHIVRMAALRELAAREGQAA